MLSIQRRGRPPKTGERFPGGDLRPLTPAEREKQQREEERQRKLAEERRIAEDKRLIHAQPHRRGDPEDSRRESPLGRFVAANKLRPEIHQGVNAFGDLWRRWCALKGAALDVQPPRGWAASGGGDGPSAEQVEAMRLRIEAIEAAVIKALTEGRFWSRDHMGKERYFRRSDNEARATFDLIRAMAAGGRDMLVLDNQAVISAMCVIAVEMGAWTKRDHPFAKR